VFDSVDAAENPLVLHESLKLSGRGSHTPATCASGSRRLGWSCRDRFFCRPSADQRRSLSVGGARMNRLTQDGGKTRFRSGRASAPWVRCPACTTLSGAHPT
jgi:hypothetical protein